MIKNQNSNNLINTIKKQISPINYYKEAGFLFTRTTGWATTLCPFHDDRNASFSINLDEGHFKCHACQASGSDIIKFHQLKNNQTFSQTLNFFKTKIKERTTMNNKTITVSNDEVKEFVLKAFKNNFNENYELVSIYNFTDVDNNYIYSKIRLEHDTKDKVIRSVSKINNVFQCKEPNFKTVYPAGCGKKPIYQLAAITAAPADETVFIVEGEKKADLLMSYDVLATTSGSSSTAKSADWQPLANRRVCIWRDNDNAGLKYQNDVIEILQQLNCTITYIDVEQLNLSKKDDVVDWVQQQQAVNITVTKELILDLKQVAVEHKAIAQQANTVAQSHENSKLYSSRSNNFRLQLTGEHAGVYCINSDDTELWLSSPVDLVAMTSNKDSQSWGKLLRWTDKNNKQHSCVMSMSLLDDDRAVRRRLLDEGVSLNNNRVAREKFVDYLQSDITTHATCVDRTGWFNKCYVLPEAMYGNAEQQIVFQSEAPVDNVFNQSGTLDEWQKHISLAVKSNSRLVFSISLAFASALLEPSNQDSGAFHLRGSSSIGKSTALEVAASVFGNPKTYKHQWRATSNALEATAVQYNDGLLVLDEISQCDPKSIGATVYMLSNEQGKLRANQNAKLKKSASWRIFVLSSGEESLASIMSKSGDKPKAGQENRLIDISADANKSLGIFDCLNSFESANQFANALKQSSTQYYGVVGQRWLQYLAENYETLSSRVEQYMNTFTQAHVSKNADGMIQRVAKRFALIAAAGELASAAGMTGWDANEATTAAVRCFNDWLMNIGGTGNFEERQVLEQIRSFIQANESSRFDVIHANSQSDYQQRIYNRVGFIKHYADRKEYWFFPEQFKSEVCKGIDYKFAASVLKSHRWLITNAGKEHTKTVRLPDTEKSTRMYVLSDLIWNDQEIENDVSFTVEDKKIDFSKSEIVMSTTSSIASYLDVLDRETTKYI